MVWLFCLGGFFGFVRYFDIGFEMRLVDLSLYVFQEKILLRISFNLVYWFGVDIVMSVKVFWVGVGVCGVVVDGLVVKDVGEEVIEFGLVLW